MKSHKNSLATAVLLAISSQALAQGTPQELDTTIIQTDSIDRDAVVSVITSDDIDTQQINDLDDLVRRTPGVSVSKGDERWGSSGFNIRGLDEDRVAINVDGVPQGETLKYEGGQAYGYFKGSRSSVDVEALKAAEIVKGADAILSGGGALAGAVNFTTKDASDFLSAEGNDTSGSIKLGHTSVNEQNMVSLALANRTSNLESLIIYTKRDGHEYENYDMGGLDVEGSEREIPNPQGNDSENVLAKLKYQISDNQSIEVLGSIYEQNVLSDEQTFNGGWYTGRIGDDVRETTQFGLTHELSAKTALFDTVTSSLTSREIEFTANTAQHVAFNFGPTFSSDEDRVDSRSIDQDLLFLSIDFAKDLGTDSEEESHKLIYGFEHQDKEISNTQIRVANSNLNTLGWVEQNIGALIPKTESEITTFYIQDTFHIGPSTQLRLGARYDSYEYDAIPNDDYVDTTGTLDPISFSSTSWTAGIEHKLNENLILEVGISTGFRAPTVEEMYTTSGDLDDWNSIPNPNLESEDGTNIDIALAGHTDSLDYRIGFWASQYKNFIDNITVTGINTNSGLEDPDGFNIPVNSGEVDMNGIEFYLAADLNKALGLAPGLTADVIAAYTQGEYDNGDPMYSVQPFGASIGLNYVESSGKWGASFYTSYTSGKKNGDSYYTEDDGSRTYPLYLSNTATVFDLVGYYDLTQSLRLTGGVYNLGDKEYYQWDNVRFVDQGDLRPGIGVTGDGVKRFSEPGRNFKLNLKYQF